MARPQGSQQTFVKSSISLPEPINDIWEALARKTSLNKTSVLIVALREMARKEGVPLDEGGESNADTDGA